MYNKSIKTFEEKKKYLFPAIDFQTPVLDRGEGSYVQSVEGEEILDLNSGQFCNILGNSNTEVLKEIFNQLSKITHTSTACLSTNVLEAAEKINSICEGFNAQSLFLSTGSEAVEAALRFSKFSKGKNGVMVLDKGYHGLTLGSQSVTYGGIYAKPRVEQVYSIPTPKLNDKNSEEKAIKKIENILKKNSDQIAAFILEPILSVGGLIYLSSQFLNKIRVLCDKYDVYLIFDECQTGYGRTGEWFQYIKKQVIPDILVLAKGLGLGFPVAAVIFNSDKFSKNNINISNYSSHQNDPFSASVINVGLKYIQDNKILDNVRKNGDYFLNELKKVENEYNNIKNARGEGLMLGFDLSLDVENYRDVSNNIITNLLNKGVMIQATNKGETFRILPDYTLKKNDIDLFIKKLLLVFNEVGLI